MKRDKPLINWDDIDSIDLDEEDLPEGYRARDTAHAVESAGKSIGIGLIIAALIGVGGSIGYIEYKEYRVDQATVIAVQRMRETAERERQRIAERDIMLNKQRAEDRETRAMHARECRYWRAQYNNHKNPKIYAMVKKHCY